MTTNSTPRTSPEDVLPVAEAALAALFTAHRVLSESMDRALRESSGLSIAQVEVLVLLNEAPQGRLRMSDIAQAVCVTRSGTTQIIDRLVHNGLAERTSGPNRREVWAQINDTGRAVAASTRPVFADEARKHLVDRLTVQQIQALRDSLQAVLPHSPGPSANTDDRTTS